MKRILNTNAYGTKVLLVIGFFLIVLPGLCYAGSTLLDPANGLGRTLLDLAKVSAGVGVFLLATFLIVLAFELAQDRIIFRQYLKNRQQKLPIAGGLYECQFCGCRTVREFDATCPACGKRLELDNRKYPPETIKK